MSISRQVTQGEGEAWPHGVKDQEGEEPAVVVTGVTIVCVKQQIPLDIIKEDITEQKINKRPV